MMRALGRGSVSSILKVILDVFRVVLWIGVAMASVGVLAALLLSFRPDLLGDISDFDLLDVGGPVLGPAAAALFLIFDLYLIGGLIVVERLRAVFATLISGDPFHPENAARLRVIALTLAALEVGRYVAAAMAHVLLHGAMRISGGVSLTTWFAVLVIVVLAEVFREGARLRGEAELTI
ncbi:MAG TPA: DUF2975 domain-containing protein [Caulobacteraceae bacterium]|jgi:hypothetical protein